MSIAKKLDQPQRRAPLGRVVSLDAVIRAAQDGQKAFNTFVATGTLPVKK